MFSFSAQTVGFGTILFAFGAFITRKVFKDMLSIFSWLLTTCLAFTSTWFVKFTNESPEKPGHLVVTRQGKVLLPIAGISLLLGLGLQIRDQLKAKRDAVTASQQTTVLTENVGATKNQLGQIFELVSQMYNNSPVLQKEAEQNDKVFSSLSSIVNTAKSTEPQLDDAWYQRIMTGRANRTPLEAAIEAGDKHKFAEALRAGEVNTTSDTGSVPLEAAALKNDLVAARQLIQAHADFNARNRFTKATPLSYAMTTAMAQLLISNGADLDAKDDMDRTPLLSASSKLQWPLVRFLMQAGAKADVMDKTGATPLKYAAKSADAESVEALLQAGADVNALGPQGASPALAELVNFDCTGKRIEVAKILIRHGATCKSDGTYWDALDIAKKQCPAYIPLLKACDGR